MLVAAEVKKGRSKQRVYLFIMFILSLRQAKRPFGQLPVRDVELDVAEAVGPQRVGDDRVFSDLGLGQLENGQLARIDRQLRAKT